MLTVINFSKTNSKRSCEIINFYFFFYLYIYNTLYHPLYTLEKEMLLTFGKYKNRDIYEILSIDKSYCKWLQKCLQCDPDIKKIIDDNLTNEYVMPFGKYKNKTLNFIKTVDIKYIDWLKNNTYVKTNCEELMNELSKISS